MSDGHSEIIDLQDDWQREDDEAADNAIADQHSDKWGINDLSYRVGVHQGHVEEHGRQIREVSAGLDEAHRQYESQTNESLREKQ